MSDLKSTGSSMKDIIITGENNPKGLIGALALAAIGLTALAIKAISGSGK